MIATHYEILGVDPDASPDAVRAAYRSRARQLHPDRGSAAPAAGSGAGVADMAAVNEAYRVLADPGRRALYDRTLSGPSPADFDPEQQFVMPAAEPEHVSRLSPSGPARVPWRLMGAAAAIGTALVLVASFFDDPPASEPPDGLLRIGSCVAFEPNGDVREVACGTEDDIVIEVLVPLDATCPAGTVGHRDRLGMGVACIPI